MENFLPIGTIVKIKNDERLVSIVGYYSLEYTVDIQILDYIGVYYPEGLLLHNNTVSFDAESIVEVVYKGYTDNSFDELNKKLTCNYEEDVEIHQEDVEPEVVLDALPEVEVTSLEDVFTGTDAINLDEPEELLGENTPKEDEFVIPHYKFDENGIIINN